MVPADCDVAPVQNATRRTATEQKQSRIRKVATLARSGEKGRALAAARNAPPVPVTEQIVQEIKSLHPTDPEPPAPAQAFVSNFFLSEVAEPIPTTPGPLGIRAETNTLLQKLDGWQEEKNVKKEGKQSSSLLLILFNSDTDEAESVTDTTKPIKVKYQIRWRPEQDAVYWIHLSTAQDAGLEFWQTGSNAIMTYQSVPKECVVKVVSESVKRDLFARQHTHRERPKSNTQTITGSYEIQHCKHASGNREKCASMQL